MPKDTIHEAIEYEEKPGQANSPAARQDEALAEATRRLAAVVLLGSSTVSRCG
jgi:hypothetical protein